MDLRRQKGAKMLSEVQRDVPPATVEGIVSDPAARALEMPEQVGHDGDIVWSHSGEKYATKTK